MFSDPKHNIEQLGLSDGNIVADFGAGSGHYALFAARAVAPSGKVFALDIQPELLTRLKKEAHKNRIFNMEVMTADLEHVGGSRIREGLCDVVIASNIFFMVQDKKSLITEARRILKSRGRLLVIDWTGSFLSMGPHGSHVFYKDDCIKLGSANGFAVERELEAGSHHYGIIFRKI